MLKLGSSSLYKIYSLVWRKDMIFFYLFWYKLAID